MNGTQKGLVDHSQKTPEDSEAKKNNNKNTNTKQTLIRRKPRTEEGFF